MFKVVRNQSGKVICFGPDGDSYSPSVAEGHTLTIEESVPVAIDTADQLTLALADLAAAYQVDLNAYRQQWASIGIADGASEEGKKTALRAAWSARTTKYSTDRALLIAQYS